MGRATLEWSLGGQWAVGGQGGEQVRERKGGTGRRVHGCPRLLLLHHLFVSPSIIYLLGKEMLVGGRILAGMEGRRRLGIVVRTG